MSRTFHHGERRIRVTGVKKKHPDTRRIARALIALALAQDEAEAQAQLERSSQKNPRTSPPSIDNSAVSNVSEDRP
jgi:hypothetical protein